MQVSLEGEDLLVHARLFKLRGTRVLYGSGNQRETGRKGLALQRGICTDVVLVVVWPELTSQCLTLTEECRKLVAHKREWHISAFRTGKIALELPRSQPRVTVKRECSTATSNASSK